MRFTDYLVTERPTPPAAALLECNRTQPLAFRYGIDLSSRSDEPKAGSIFALPSLHIDSRDSDGRLSIYQSTPSGTFNTIFVLDLLQILFWLICVFFQDTSRAK
jgi:hypothetical protein